MALNGSLGRPIPMNIPQKPPGKREPVDKLWVRVCYTMLWENAPTDREPNKTVAMRVLGMTANEISNVPSNIKRNVQTGLPDVSRLMNFAQEQFKNLRSSKLTDYIP